MVPKKSIFSKVRELQKICWDIEWQSDEYKNDLANWEPIYITRRISIWITYFLRDSRLTPTQITALWIFIGILGALLFILNVYWTSLLALILLYISWVLDNVDGELARLKKQFSKAGDLLDMLGHEIIFPVIFACLTFSLILQRVNSITIFLGLMATAFVTPISKMHEKVKLLLCMMMIYREEKFEKKEAISPRSGKEDERRCLKDVIAKVIAIIFSQTAILYLLIVAVIFKIESIYLTFYGLGLPLMFIPKYFARAKELTKITEDIQSLKNQFRPEWMDC